MRFLFLMFTPFLAFSAGAQSELETDLDAELTVLLATGEDKTGEPDRSGAMTELSVSTSAAYLFENGLELTGRLTFRAQTDHPSRPGFAGSVFDCPVSAMTCPQLAGNGLRGAFSRLSTFDAGDETGGRGSLEAAYLALQGGWGEIVIGRDQGVAQRFYEGGPTVFRLGKSNNPVLDPFGSALSRTKNDISSSAEKVSLVSKRILGVRAGVSYTPDAGFEGLDLNTDYRTQGVIEPELGAAYEAGLQVTRSLRQANLRVRGSATWSKAEVKSAVYEDVETVSAGFEIERRDVFRVGLSMLDSSNGGFGRYQSIAAGASWWVGPDWIVTGSVDHSEDKTIDLKGWSATLGASRSLNEHVDLTFGYRVSETDFPSVPLNQKSDWNQSGLLLEVRIRK